MKVVVGMSGGVDSSTTALLLKKKGFDVIGITLKLNDISNEKDIEDAKKVANILGIDHYVVDFRDIFKEKVIDYFINSYTEGLTPNPCAICNRDIKNDIFIKYVLENFNVDKVATGHYVKLEEDKKLGLVIKRGKDKSKDQSYFMALVKRKFLDYLLFPLGDYTKEEVRKIAEENSLPVFSKGESFEICFTGGETPAEFLTKNNLYKFEKGDIIHISGKKLGKHKGLPFYTIGQRRGLGVRWHKPLYVLEKDIKTNSIIVGEREHLLTDYVEAKDLNLLVDINNWDKERICIQGRYRQKCLPISDFRLFDDKIRFFFKEPQEKFAKGQILAIYQDDTLLGGGIII